MKRKVINLKRLVSGALATFGVAAVLAGCYPTNTQVNNKQTEQDDTYRPTYINSTNDINSGTIISSLLKNNDLNIKTKYDYVDLKLAQIGNIAVLRVGTYNQEDELEFGYIDPITGEELIQLGYQKIQSSTLSNQPILIITNKDNSQQYLSFETLNEVDKKTGKVLPKKVSEQKNENTSTEEKATVTSEEPQEESIVKYIKVLDEYTITNLTEEEAQKLVKAKQTYEQAEIIKVKDKKFIKVSVSFGNDGILSYDDLHVIVTPGKYYLKGIYDIETDLIIRIATCSNSHDGYFSLLTENEIIPVSYEDGLSQSPVKIGDNYYCIKMTSDGAYSGLFDLNNRRDLLPVKYNHLDILKDGTVRLNEDGVVFTIDIKEKAKSK